MVQADTPISRGVDGANVPADDVIVLGAGAAGLMCAAAAGRRGRRVRILERAERIGKKILVSGGGRCNFTNLHAGPDNYLSAQPGFCRSALARYRPEDFVALVERHGVAYHEKKLGQLFCDGSSRGIVELLAAECADARVRIETGRDVREVARESDGTFCVRLDGGLLRARSLVVACGGLSWAKLGGSDLAYRLARSFGLRIVEARPGLVPLTFAGEHLAFCEELSGVSLPCAARALPAGGGAARTFHESLLFTHRGLSGPAVLQISSYLPGELHFDLLPDAAAGEDWLAAAHAAGRDTLLPNVLAERLPTRVAQAFSRVLGDPPRPLRRHGLKPLAALERALRRWTPPPAGTEGYAKAEVTLGGVDTRDLHGKTLEARDVPGLFFVGEAVDVTGQLGGFNFQWAWASGHAAGEVA